MEAQAEGQRSYQHVLGPIGGYLDHETFDRFRMLEEHDGFTVVLEQDNATPRLRWAHLSREKLIEQNRQLEKGRRVFGHGRGNAWKLSEAGRLDVFRALGYELDDSSAHELCIDELDDALLVTYSYQDPAQGYGWRKRLVLLRRLDIKNMLTADRTRRSRKGLLGIFRR